MSKEILAKVLESVRQVKPLPESISALIRVVGNPHHTRDDVIRVLRTDPVIAGKLIQWSNSGFFGRGQICWSLEDALGRLGEQRLCVLAMAYSAQMLRNQSLLGYGLEKGIWSKSISTAVIAEILARYSSVPSGVAYLTGLLLDVGKVALDHYVLQYQLEMMLAPDPFDQLEKVYLGIDHALVGAMLLKNWNLPQEMVLAVRYHHDLKGLHIESSFIEELIHLVHLADAFSSQLEEDLGSDGLRYELSDSSIQWLQNHEQNWSQLEKEFISAISLTKQVLS